MMAMTPAEGEGAPRGLTFPALWRQAIRRHGARPLLRNEEDGGTCTYGEAGEIVAAMGRRLAASGIGRGDRIAIIAPVRAETILLCWAVMDQGAVVVPLDHRLPDPELLAVCAQAEPSLLFCGRDQAALKAMTGIPAILLEDGGEDLLPGTSLAEWLREASADGCPGNPRPPAVPAPGDPAAILFTSGTSGRAKGVVLSHAALCLSGALMASTYAWRPEDVLFNLGELHTMSGLRNPCLAALHAGCSFVVAPAAVRASSLLVSACIERHRVSLLACVPAMVLQFTRFRQRIAPGSLATLRMALCTGSRLPPAWAQEFESAFAVPVMNYYGLTETAGLCAGRVPGGDGLIPASLGVPLGCRVAILDEQGVPVPAGGVGELLISSDQLMSSYWRAPELTHRVLRDGWFHTGDLVRQGADGSLILIDRRGEAFKDARGEFIHPEELEQALERHPRVAEAGVRGGDGEASFTAFVVPLDRSLPWPDMEAELRGFMSAQLGAHRTPARILRAEALPRGANGKLLRRKLSEDCTRNG